MKLYYRIWVDCITRLRSIEANKVNWQIKGIVMMSTAMTFNFVLNDNFSKEYIGLYFL